MQNRIVKVLMWFAISGCCCFAIDSVAAKTQKSIAKILGEYPGLGEKLGASWYYNWRGSPGEAAPLGMEFVPMVWGGKKGTDGLMDADHVRAQIRKVLAENPGCKNLLSFNEPNAAKQSNLSVRQVLEVWPVFEQELKGRSIRLGSPGVAGIDSDWLHEFMEEAIKRGYKVDFLCVHRRVDFRNNPVDTVLDECRALYGKYKKPIWITELELVGKGVTERDVIRFYQQLADQLEHDSSINDMIERYAVAYAPPDTTIDYKIVARPCNADGTLTGFGRAFQKLHTNRNR